MSTFEPGTRVITAHGPGVIDNIEQCNDAWPGQPPRMVHTGRRGVKLDNNPFVGIKDGIAYYWPNELKLEGT